MLVVNLFGAPGAGKSTGAAYIFSQLKINGINVELVTEFAKDMTWEKNRKALTNQIYMLGNQLQRIYRCQDEVDVIVTDSPILLNILYNNNPILDENFERLVVNIFKSYNNLNYYVQRVKNYNPIGRNETEEEANKIANKLTNLLNKENIPFKYIKGQLENYQEVVEDVLEVLNVQERF